MVTLVSTLFLDVEASGIRSGGNAVNTSEMRRRQIEELAVRVKAVLEQHGSAGVPMSLRAADRKTGVNYVTLGRMHEGFVPEMESVVRFARGFGLDVNEWLTLAGYDPITATDPAGSGADSEENPLDYLQREIGKLTLALAARGRSGELDDLLGPILTANEGGFDAMDLPEAQQKARDLWRLAELEPE